MHQLRTFVSAAVVIAMMALFLYALWRFPDNPQYPCTQHGYCGKQGQPHTREDFEAFTAWSDTVFWVWPLGMLTAFFLKPKPSSDYVKIRAGYKSDAKPDDPA